MMRSETDGLMASIVTGVHLVAAGGSAPPASPMTIALKPREKCGQAIASLAAANQPFTRQLENVLYAIIGTAASSVVQVRRAHQPIRA